MRKFLLLIMGIVFLINTQAQQLHSSSMFVQNNPMFNPGASGMNNYDVIGLNYRSQWNSVSGHPETSTAFADIRWKKMDAGVSAYIYSDKTGPSSRTGIQTAISYHVKTSEKSRLGLGIELRALQFAIDKSKIQAALVNDPVLAGKSNISKFDMGVGAYYQSDFINFGIAVQQILQGSLKINDISAATLRAKLYRHYNIIVNKSFDAANEILIIPSILFRIVENAPNELEGGIKLDYQKQFWWAINYRMQQSYSLQAGFTMAKKIDIGFAYDVYKNPVSVFEAGSSAIEFSLRYKFKQ